MTNYFIDLRTYSEPGVCASFITEDMYRAAERGENYLDPNDYSLWGEFESAEAAFDHWVVERSLDSYGL